MHGIFIYHIVTSVQLMSRLCKQRCYGTIFTAPEDEWHCLLLTKYHLRDCEFPFEISGSVTDRDERTHFIMSTQDIIEDAKPMTDDLRELMITNKALLGAVKDIQHMLQNEKQIPYPVTLITKQKDSFCTSSLNITHFIDDCQGCLEWISNPEEHLELDRRRKTLKMLWPSTTDDG